MRSTLLHLSSTFDMQMFEYAYQKWMGDLQMSSIEILETDFPYRYHLLTH